MQPKENIFDGSTISRLKPGALSLVNLGSVINGINRCTGFHVLDNRKGRRIAAKRQAKLKREAAE